MARDAVWFIRQMSDLIIGQTGSLYMDQVARIAALASQMGFDSIFLNAITLMLKVVKTYDFLGDRDV